MLTVEEVYDTNGVYSGDVVNQAKDSNTKFIVSSQKCAGKSVDVKDKLSQQIKVMIRLTLRVQISKSYMRCPFAIGTISSL